MSGIPAPMASRLVVVDTDVASMFFKRDSRSTWYEPYLIGRTLVLSAQSRAELYRWPIERNWGSSKRGELESFIHSRFSVEFPTDQLCRVYGELMVRARRLGRPLPATDAWQAATAVTLEIPLVTHNASNYSGVPQLTVISSTFR